jgi:hypothetical protein
MRCLPALARLLWAIAQCSMRIDGRSGYLVVAESLFPECDEASHVLHDR